MPRHQQKHIMRIAMRSVLWLCYPKAGYPSQSCKNLVNNNADESGMLLAKVAYVPKQASQIYTFLQVMVCSDDGRRCIVAIRRLPFAWWTAIHVTPLCWHLAANPAVTVFLDTCYSGTTRGTDMLIASRPIAIRALEQSIPDNFTVMTAAAVTRQLNH